MARTRSFVDRLAKGPARPEIESVALNLEHLLNTRKGCGSVVFEFGIGEYEAASSTLDAVVLLCDEIATLTRRYEQRFEEPEVSLLGRTSFCKIRLELAGRLRGQRRTLWLDVNTNTRRVDVAVVKELAR